MKNTISFLKKIKKNNNTPWMHAHKDEYLTAKKEFEFLVQELIVRTGQWDNHLPHLEVKDCMFRFNRDIRFSDNKNPYKENFGAYLGYSGKKGILPGYYFHVSPKEIFAAGGVWMPEAPELLKLRRYISANGSELEKIVKDKKFKKAFGGLSTEQVLKRAPKGFSPEDNYVEFLKLKSFTVSSEIAKGDVFKPGLGKLIEAKFKLMKPLNEFLREALRS